MRSVLHALTRRVCRRFLPDSRRLILGLTVLLVACGVSYAQTSEPSPSPQNQTEAAQRIFGEGEKLREQDTKDSLAQAIRKYEEALTLARASGARQLEGSILISLGETSLTTRELRKAVSYLDQALPITREVGDLKGEGVTLNNLGGAYNLLGENQKAIEFYSQALPIRRKLGDRRAEAVTLNNLGLAYNSLEEKQKALDYLSQALALRREVGDRKGEATTLNNICLVYLDIEELQKALEFQLQSLPIRREVKDKRGEAVSLSSISVIYSRIGEDELSLSYLTQALAVNREIGNKAGEGRNLTNLGFMYAKLGDHQKAIEFLSQGLPLVRETNNRETEMLALGTFANIYHKLGELQKALDYYSQALNISLSLGDRRREATIQSGFGAIYLDLGQFQQAIEHLDRTITIAQEFQHPASEAYALFVRAKVHRALNDFKQARSDIEASLKIVESLRSKVGADEFRTTFSAGTRDYYEFYIDLLAQQARTEAGQSYGADAFQVSERSRARALLELLVEARADIRQGVGSELLERERALQRALDKQARELTLLLAGKHSAEQLDKATNELKQLESEYQNIQAQIRQTSPRYAALTQPEPLTLAEIQGQLLDKDTLLLEYALGEKRSYLFAVGHNSLATYELPARAKIEQAARHVYELLTARNRRVRFETIEEKRARITQAESEWPQAAAALSRMLLASVAPQLGVKRLLVVSDGALQYIPFASLPAPAEQSGSGKATQPPTPNPQPLIARHEIVNLPSASTLSVLRRETAGRPVAAKLVAVLADPVFDLDDERLKQALRKEGPPSTTTVVAQARTRGDENLAVDELTRAAQEVSPDDSFKLARLPFTRREAEAIIALAPATGRKEALDFKASRETATGAELGQYRIVHFATHGFLNSAHPALSGLVFSLVDEKGERQDGFLRAREIYNLKLPSDLVVLSGCRTGLGKEVRGEGLVGLTRGFMYAGAARVMVSLWDINDEATAELMKRFYEGLLGRKKLSPAAALRAAQISMAQDKPWAAPYYWAAFMLQGEPR